MITERAFAGAVEAMRPREKAAISAQEMKILAEYIKNNPVTPETFLNINYPNIPFSEISGIEYTFLSKRYYRDTYIKRETGTKELKVSLNGHIDTDSKEGNDDYAIKRGYISITPMTVDSTDYKKIKEILEND